MRSETGPDDRVKYCSYLLCDMEDILCIHNDTISVLQHVHQLFLLKLGYAKSDMYLDTKVQKTRLHNGVWAYAKSLTKYVHEVIRNCKAHLCANNKSRYRLPKRAENPLAMGFDPKMVKSQELRLDSVSYFQSIIGTLRWITELGRVAQRMASGGSST